IAGERGLRVDREGFDAALAAQQERSRAGSQFSGGVFVSETLPVRETLGEFQDRERQFVGYESLRSEAVIRGLWDGANWVTKAAEGANVGIVLDRSPFYGEAGGQSGDRGAIAGPRGEAEVGATVWVDDVLLHQAVVRRGALAVQDPVRAEVDAGRRLAVARGHTATHLLHWALRSVLGPEAVQAGSYVDADRLRFDFASRQALHEEQRWRIETLVNQRVRLADEVRTRHMALDEAKRSGAIAMFGEKYGARVRVVEIGDYSKELCGGTHLLHTGSVGSLAIVSEGSIAAGTRRVEAAVGEAAYARQHDAMRLLHDVARRLGRPAEGVAAGLEELLTQLRESERARKALQTELAAVTAERLTARGKQLDGAVLIAAELERTDRELLTQLADAVRNSVTTEAVVVLVSSPGPDQVAWVMATTRGLAKRLHAGAMLKTIAAMTDGSGGGRPDFAQAGGRAPGKIRDALDRVEGLVREALARAPRA
ncbi:MAG TPA: alanine--tRNA ligase-related protein, partial [bacterium]